VSFRSRSPILSLASEQPSRKLDVRAIDAGIDPDRRDARRRSKSRDARGKDARARARACVPGRLNRRSFTRCARLRIFLRNDPIGEIGSAEESFSRGETIFLAGKVGSEEKSATRSQSKRSGATASANATRAKEVVSPRPRCVPRGCAPPS